MNVFTSKPFTEPKIHLFVLVLALAAQALCVTLLHAALARRVLNLPGCIGVDGDSASRVGTHNHLDPVISTSWLKQGPLGLLLFALALMEPVQCVAESHPGAHVFAHFGDINIVGAPDPAGSAFDRLTSETLSIVLTPVPHKCSVYGRKADAATLLQRSWALRIVHRAWWWQAPKLALMPSSRSSPVRRLRLSSPSSTNSCPCPPR
jgi:hypothetical protein